MANQLSKLVRKADAVSNAASVLVSSTIREVRGKLYDLSDRMNLAGSADDREYAYDIIRRTWARLSRRLNALMDAQNQLAARGAAKDAGQMTGLEIKYSAARANAILELVTPAQGENLAAVFTQRMSKRMIDTLRESTVSALREQAVAGGTVKELSREMATRWAEALKTEDPKFVDSAGHVWDTKRYFQMNARTNTMRVYNDCLVDNVARETGSDLMRISTGGDPDCDCFAWEGCIVSVSGKTKGFPTYEDARRGGCFHPNCTHTLEYVDEVADAEEIELQKEHPADPDNADDPTAQDDRRYEIDQARKMRDEGMTQDEARVAVDRDNLADAIRSGLVRSDAEELVRKMTDEQVTRLCPNGNPPAFVPAKGTKKHPEPEVWNHGKMGGVVHIRRGADLDTILKVCKVDKPLPPKTPPKTSGKQPVEPPKNQASKSIDPKAEAVEKQRKADFDKLVSTCDKTEITGRRGTTFKITDEMMKQSFEHTDPNVIGVFSKAVSSIRPTFDGSACGGTRVNIGHTAWDNHPQTWQHECGHAVLNFHNQTDASKSVFQINRRWKEELSPYGKTLFDKLTNDAESFFDRVCGKKVQIWKNGAYVDGKARAWNALTDEMITKELFGVEKSYSSMTRDEQRVYGAVSDTLEGVTNYKFVGKVGHSASYWRSRGWHGRFHEPFANVTALISFRNHEPAYMKAMNIFKGFSKAIAKDFYGIELD